MPNPDQIGVRKQQNIGINSFVLVAAIGFLVAVKLWAGAPIPWWLALLPIWLLLAVTTVTVVAGVALGGFAALAVWVRRRAGP